MKTQSGTALKVSDIARVVQAPKIRLGQIGKAIRRHDGKIADNGDAIEGVVLLQKGDDSDATLVGIHDKVKELNDHVLPPGVKVVPFLDRSDLLKLTTHTVLHNLTEGIVLVVIILFLFLGNLRARSSLLVPFRSRCCSRPSVSTCATSPPTCSRWARWTSAWSSMAPL